MPVQLTRMSYKVTVVHAKQVVAIGVVASMFSEGPADAVESRVQSACSGVRCAISLVLLLVAASGVFGTSGSGAHRRVPF